MQHTLKPGLHPMLERFYGFTIKTPQGNPLKSQTLEQLVEMATLLSKQAEELDNWAWRNAPDGKHTEKAVQDHANQADDYTSIFEETIYEAQAKCIISFAYYSGFTIEA